MSKKTANDELQNLSPLLRDLKRDDDGFRLPDGYFEGLEDSVFRRADGLNSPQKSIFSAARRGLFARLTRSKIVWAAAATLALALAATWFFKIKQTQSDIAPIAAQALTEEEIEAYVLENIDEFEAEQLAALPAAEQIIPKPTTPSVLETKPKHTSPIEDFSEEELEFLLKDMSDEELESLLKS